MQGLVVVASQTTKPLSPLCADSSRPKQPGQALALLAPRLLASLSLEKMLRRFWAKKMPASRSDCKRESWQLTTES